MSYILDALNKADKDRQQQAPISTTPASSQHKPTTAHQTNAGKYSLFIVSITVILLILWVFVNSNETPSQQQDAIPQNTQIITPAPKSKPIVQVQETTPQPIQPTATKHEPAQEKVKNIPNIMALDSEIRNQLPPIAISAHVYSESTNKRMVIINNQVKHEQQYIAENLQLTHITPHGIQLQYQDAPFTMTVKDQWPPY
ncbi:MAG: general secretion pathway protein GspB [Ghiorsea sp.]|nr:general secretion pathway protein GspB [Ghiorsea sp.]